MAADLDSLRWKIYLATERSPERIERVLKEVAEHLCVRGYTGAAVFLTSVRSPIVCEIVPKPTTDNPDNFFDKQLAELAVHADNIDTEHF